MDKVLSSMASYASSCHYNDVPEDAVTQCKVRIIDSIACASAAHSQPLPQKLQNLSRSYPEGSGATIWGTKTRTSVEMAAFVNGSMLRFLDLSDTYLSKTAGHPSDMIGALIASAEANQIDGKGLITSIVVAYEIYCGLADVVELQPKSLDQATLAAMGTAAGIGNQLGFEVEQMKNAISFAVTSNLHLYNIRTDVLSDWKSCAGPNGARNGTFSALMAQNGITAPPSPFDGKGGFFDIVEPFDWNFETAKPRILETHLKLHPVCYHGQAAVDAASALRSKVNVDNISEVIVETYDSAYRAMASDDAKWRPKTRETADHSLPFAIAVTLLEGKLSLECYADSNLENPRIQEQMNKVVVKSDPLMTDAYPEKVQTRITLVEPSGDIVTHLQEYPKGHCKNPLNKREIEEKFKNLFGYFGPENDGQKLLDYIWNIDGEKSLAIPF